MMKPILALAITTMVAVSDPAFSQECEQVIANGYTPIKSCTITGLTDATGNHQAVEVCLGHQARSGGPFGGEDIHWFNLTMTLSSEGVGRYTMELTGPDGRHNFRSPIDYSVIDFESGLFQMESNRSKYDDAGKGFADLHEVSFDLNSGAFQLLHQTRQRGLFQRWINHENFMGTCR